MRMNFSPILLLNHAYTGSGLAAPQGTINGVTLGENGELVSYLQSDYSVIFEFHVSETDMNYNKETGDLLIKTQLYGAVTVHGVELDA